MRAPGPRAGAGWAAAAAGRSPAGCRAGPPAGRTAGAARRRLAGCPARRTPTSTGRRSTPRALRAGLTGPGLWTRVDLRDETGSTNADAAAAARDGEPEGLVVVAERQTAGRGRLGRDLGVAAARRHRGERPAPARRGGPERGWPAVPPAGTGWLPLLAGVALVEAVDRLAELPTTSRSAEVAQRPAGRRPPKCAGILAEGVPDGAGRVGVGLNVTLRADELPDGPNGLPATSLRLRGAAVTDRDPLLRALLRGLESWYGRWRRPAATRQPAGCATRTSTLRDRGPRGAGAAAGRRRADRHGRPVDATGRLVVRTAAGPQPIAAGDVLHLR